MVTRGAGYAQFDGFSFLVRSEFHIPQAEFDRRKRGTWPELPSTIEEFDVDDTVGASYQEFFDFDEKPAAADDSNAESQDSTAQAEADESQTTSEAATEDSETATAVDEEELTPEERYARAKQRSK